MPERDEPDFDWLYGTQRKGVGSSGRDGRAGQDAGDGADDATRVQPVQGDRQPSSRDPEPTQKLPTLNRGGSDRARRSGSERASAAPYQAPPPARPRKAPSSGGSGRRRFRFRWGYLWAFLALWLVFLITVPLIAWSRIEKVDATPRGSRPPDQQGTTYLLVGSDSREGLTRKQQLALGVGKGAGRRTDTIMLLHIGAGPNLLMSIPRDSIVPIPDHGTTKINAAFAFGGPRLLAATIENNTGIRIDDYIEIGFSGFVDVVDAVGGIEICPKANIKDRRADLDIKKGCQDVDGKVALGYSRSRHGQKFGDITRARHQREVVSAVGSEAVSPWSVINPIRYYRLWMAGANSLRVGEDTGMIATMRFALAMRHVSGKNGLTCGVPISDLAVHWDPDRSKKLFKLIAQDRTEDVSKNLCRQSGLSGG
jgi:LCP family protein required for cell wall assembly